jgi:DNA-binding CsgD family transcriptional regulator
MKRLISPETPADRVAAFDGRTGCGGFMLLLHEPDTPLAPSAHVARFKVGGIECFVVPLGNEQPPSDAVLGTFTVAGQNYGVVGQARLSLAPDLVDLLTPRELEIAVLVAAGCGCKAIARRLRISFHTVRVHLARTYAKLGLHKQTELAAWIAARLP